MIGVRRLLVRRGERGSAAIEAAIGLPPFLLFVAMIILGGRVMMAHQAVESAAYDAARAASIERSSLVAAGAAKGAARSSLAAQGVRCVTQRVQVDTAGYNTPIGTPGRVSVTVSCNVDLADLGIPGLPGSRRITATASSAVDAYRERR